MLNLVPVEHNTRGDMKLPHGQGGFSLSSPEMDEIKEFQCLGLSNWTISSSLNPLYPRNFSNSTLSFWEANSYYPRGPIMGKGNFPTPKLNETEGFQCLGLSNWTICSPLSPFCPKRFSTFSPSYWGANSYYP